MAKVKSNILEVADAWEKDILKQVENATTRAMVKTGLVGEARVRGIVEKEAYDTGRLLRSVNAEIKKSGLEMSLIIGTNLEYAVALEEGRKPGKWPNLNAIVKWAGRKLRQQGINTRVNVSFDELKNLARSGRKPATPQQKAYRAHLAAVYLIGRKIATKGIRGKMIFKRLEDGLLEFFRQELQKELKSVA